MPAKYTTVDRWRTGFWALGLHHDSGMTVNALQERLAALRRLDLPAKPSNAFRKYFDLDTVAPLSIEGDRGRSWILVGDAVVPRSRNRYLHPIFNLLEEVLLRPRQDLARARYLKRIAAEVHLGLRSHEGLTPDERNHPAYISDDRMAEILAPYACMNALRRIRSHILELPLRELIVSGLFSVQLPSLKVARQVRPVNHELIDCTFENPIDQCALVLGLCLEALELDDEQRRRQLSEELVRAFKAVRSDQFLGRFAGEIWAVIETGILDVEATMYDTAIQRIERAASLVAVHLNATRGFGASPEHLDLLERACNAADEVVAISRSLPRRLAES